MLGYTDPNRLKKIIYFSTASILTGGNQLSPAAKTEGSPYVKSKLAAFNAIQDSQWADKVVTLFPTMVLGGGKDAPYSHISQGLLDIRKHISWARWFHLNGAFHFLHAEDIAKMVIISMTQDVPKDMVMGNPKITFNEAILELAETVGKKPWLQLHIPQWVIHALVVIFKRRMDSWGAHCAKNPHFLYSVHAPYHFGEALSFSSLKAVVEKMGV
jgi:nucleoside-diphosphate-sugar epimerase